MGVALVLIYPCGKARNSPPEGVLTEGRQTYEMAVQNGLGLPAGDSSLGLWFSALADLHRLRTRRFA